MIAELLGQINISETIMNTSKILLANIKTEIMDEEFIEKYSRFVATEIFNNDEIIEKIIEVYDEVYTLEEIEYLHHFYTSDIGKTILNKATLCSEKIMELGSSSMMTNFDKVIQFIVDNDTVISKEEKDEYKTELYNQFMNNISKN